MDKKPSAVKEATIERELVRRVEALGGVCEKVMCAGKRGFFDRLVILPADQWGRGPRIIFAELKRPKRGRISPHQQSYHEQYRTLGVDVVIIRNPADIDRLLAAP
jgi:hypothetical protein